ncbi:MAG TPA: biopolymer transporter ExbD [Terracidiphilus sp.]|nr:biopolymer transporter ExbD [Terracidiphilus sp.]
MSMTTGGEGTYSSDINVTPMIDILLVLLIIFMVIVPVTPKGLDALVPQPPKKQQQQQQNDRTIVVQVLYRPGAAPTYKINDTEVNHSDLLPKLTEIYANRAERVMFVKGDDDLDFRYVADVIDIGKAANVDHIGLMTPKILAGQ